MKRDYSTSNTIIDIQQTTEAVEEVDGGGGEKDEVKGETSKRKKKRSVKFRRASKNSRLQKGIITRVRIYLVAG